MDIYINLQKPVVVGSVTWTTERWSAGKLEFKVLRDNELRFEEGDPVRFGEVFYGFVFSKSHSKDNIISVTAYDQMIYLAKNKDSITYEKKSASALLKMLAGDFQLRLGDVEETKHRLSRIEDNVTLLDMMANALDETLTATTELFELYDDFGKLTLRNAARMDTGLLIDAETGENFTLSSSIDDGVYNQIKLIYESSESGTREVYMAKDSSKIAKWGLLQYFDALKDPAHGKRKADGLLDLYGQVRRSLDIKGALGDFKVRSSSLVAVALDLGERKVNQKMLVTSCKHVYTDTRHTMDLKLRGGDIG